LLEEGNAFDAEAVKRCGRCRGCIEAEARTHQVLQDDVPPRISGQRSGSHSSLQLCFAIKSHHISGQPRTLWHLSTKNWCIWALRSSFRTSRNKQIGFVKLSDLLFRRSSSFITWQLAFGLGSLSPGVVLEPREASTQQDPAVVIATLRDLCMTSVLTDS
jgi:hypothetical protein